MPEQSGCLLAILKLFGLSLKAPSALPYRRKDYLLSPAERSLFGVLCEILKDRYFVFAKVRLADLVWMPKGTVGRQGHFNRVQAKHVDFVVCDRSAVRPLVCIELDDSTHSLGSRQARDIFVDAALQAAGLPLLRVVAARSYNAAELRRKIESVIANGTS